MSAVASGLSFEVLRFTVEPVSAEVALLELEGRFRAETRRRLGVPRLMAESDEGSREVAPAAANEAQAEPDDAPLAVPEAGDRRFVSSWLPPLRSPGPAGPMVDTFLDATHGAFVHA